MEEEKIPAVGIAMVDKDGPVWIESLGKANIEKNIDTDNQTMFRIGSTSKMFVALAILKMQEEGLVSLKDTVRNLIPEIEFTNPWAEIRPILVEHLIEHTTGWDDYHNIEYAHSEIALSLKEGLDFHPQSRVSRWMPGTRMSYCNSGPPVAAYIVQKLSGKRYEDYIQKHVFNKAGMKHTKFINDGDSSTIPELFVDLWAYKHI
jgi:CubicO group peptidase (beta-lactamase class C family)